METSGRLWAGSSALKEAVLGARPSVNNPFTLTWTVDEEAPPKTSTSKGVTTVLCSSSKTVPSEEEKMEVGLARTVTWGHPAVAAVVVSAAVVVTSPAVVVVASVAIVVSSRVLDGLLSAVLVSTEVALVVAVVTASLVSVVWLAKVVSKIEVSVDEDTGRIIVVDSESVVTVREPKNMLTSTSDMLPEINEYLLAADEGGLQGLATAEFTTNALKARDKNVFECMICK